MYVCIICTIIYDACNYVCVWCAYSSECTNIDFLPKGVSKILDCGILYAFILNEKNNHVFIELCAQSLSSV